LAGKHAKCKKTAKNNPTLEEICRDAD